MATSSIASRSAARMTAKKTASRKRGKSRAVTGEPNAVQLRAARDFIRQAGGIEAAEKAFAQMEELRRFLNR